MNLRRLYILVFLIPIFFIFTGSTKQKSSDAKFDLIIKEGEIIDGTGYACYFADIGINDGKIVRIGDLLDYKGRVEIDAGGLIVCPGFIDLHTHVDMGLVNQPYAENFIRDGVTTVVGGNCGYSVQDITDYFKTLKEKGIVLNAATLIGHNTILRQVKGNVGTPLNAYELDKCKSLLRRAMEDGAFGMSTGLIYTPGKYSSTEEIIELQKVVGEYGGLYATHMRSEGTEILRAIDEALRIGGEVGCRVEISHFKIPGDNTIGGSDTIIRKVRDARSSGLRVWIDQYPYTASSTNMSVLFPDWLLENGGNKAKEILLDSNKVKRVLESMKEDYEIKRDRKDFAYAVITSSRAYPEFEGRNLKEVAQILKLRKEKGDNVNWRNISPENLPEVTMEDQYLAIIDIYLKGGASCVYHTMTEDDVINIMRQPFIAVCSDSGIRDYGIGKPHPRGYGSNARVLGRYVREKNVLTLEEAIKKMASVPANSFEFKRRGFIRENYWADITIFNPDTVIDKATYENPHQYPEGIEYVIVNGEVVLENGNLTGKLPGVPLYGPGYIPN